MKPTAIVYTSGTGHTRQYALMLGEQIGLPVYSLDEANSQLFVGGPVIYLGWIHASHVKGYAKATSRFELCAVCAVGLCDTDTLTDQVRKATSIPEEIPLFTLQGGFDRSRLKGILWCLMQKELCTRDELIEDLWTNGMYIDGNTLCVNIGRLREKLAQIGAKDFIRTVRGVGYRL